MLSPMCNKNMHSIFSIFNAKVHLVILTADCCSIAILCSTKAVLTPLSLLYALKQLLVFLYFCVVYNTKWHDGWAANWSCWCKEWCQVILMLTSMQSRRGAMLQLSTTCLPRYVPLIVKRCLIMYSIKYWANNANLCECCCSKKMKMRLMLIYILLSSD